jgi:energy-coupling factor transporter ATP-binding protein EcfA2
MGMYPPPLKCPDRYLNLWSGFNVSPQEGDVSKFTQFVFDVVCKSDQEKYEWLIDWLAHICQLPGEKIGTAVVIYGSEGTGKNTLTKALSLLLRPGNYTQIINARQILSNFNSYLMNSVVCVFNEAVWSGSPKEANILKGLVTEDFLSIEMKGIDMFNARNCTRFVILTNNPWAVPAGHQSRRYFVVEISDVNKGDTAYWEDLHHWIEQHPQELLYFLLARDIKSDLREAIETDELRKQREMTAERDMKVEDQIALDLVTKGKAVIASKGNYEGKWIWPNNYLLDAIRKVDPFAKATGQFSRKIKRLFEEQGYVLREGRSKLEGRFLLLPETPMPLLECLSKKYSIYISELEEARYWTQDQSYRVNYPY